jgi:N-acetylneuraminic acid mutarotase
MKPKINLCTFILMSIVLTGLISCSKSSDKEILSFKFNGLNPPVEAVISGTTITATVEDGTDVTNLVPTIQVSEKASVSPNSGIAQDFSQPVTYTVTAEDGSNKNYSASLTIGGGLDNVDINWTELADAPTKRAWTQSVTVEDKIYVIGGLVEATPVSTIEVYDPATNTWDTTKSKMNYKRWGHSAIVVGGKIYVMGGIETTLGSATTSAEVFDPVTDTWEEIEPMPNVRATHGSCVLDGKIYLIGGEPHEPPGGEFLSSVDVYDPQNNTWSSAAQLPQPNIYLSASVVNGKIYAIGGAIHGGEAAQTIFEYDPQTDQWTQKSNLKTGRWSLTTVTIDDMIYCIGGSTGPTSSGVTRVEVYSPGNDKCYTATGLLYKCYGQGTTVYQNKIYVFDGCASPPPNYETFSNKSQVGVPALK